MFCFACKRVAYLIKIMLIFRKWNSTQVRIPVPLLDPMWFRGSNVDRLKYHEYLQRVFYKMDNFKDQAQYWICVVFLIIFFF
jgi:hypothetical protein